VSAIRAAVMLKFSNKRIKIDYTNWRGERRWREVRPVSLSFASTSWHPEPQYLLTCVDIEDGKEKQFAAKDIHDWETIPDEVT
jgi:hypothetical protein